MIKKVRSHVILWTNLPPEMRTVFVIFQMEATIASNI